MKISPQITVSVVLLEAAAVVGALLGLSNRDFHPAPSGMPAVGAVVPIATSFYNDSLQSGITASQTAFSLVSGKDAQGNSLSGTYGFVIDQGSSSQEIVYCTNVSGSTVSGCVRGVDLTTGTTSVAALEQVHNRGASVQITAAPVVNIMANILRGVESINQAIFYNSNIATATLAANRNNIPSVGLLNDTAIAGAPNASEITDGISQLATAAQQASSTILGSTSGVLVTQARYATDTPQSKCNSLGSAAGSGCSVIADLTGHIKQAWIDISATASWVFSGTVSIAASTAHPLTLNGQALVFPPNQGAASSTVLENDGNGNTTWESTTRSLYVNGTELTTSNTSSTTLATIIIPANSLTTSSKIETDSIVAATTNNCIFSVDFGSGSATTSLMSAQTSGSVFELKNSLFASSTAAENSMSVLINNSSPLTVPARGVMTYNTATTLYIALTAKVLSGGTCLIDGGSVVLIK